MERIKTNEVAILMGFLILSIIYLCYYYRMGGIKDLGIVTPTLRDVGVYLDTGRQVLAQQNPYTGTYSQDGTVARSWQFGPTVLTILTGWLPMKLVTPTFQLLNFFGIFGFIYLISTKLKTRYFLLILLIVIWSSPTREMLVTNQITGLIMGLISFPIILYRKYQIKQRNINALWYPFMAFPIATAIDLKPHIAIGLVVTIFFLEKVMVIFIIAVGELVFFHALIDLYHGEILEIDWLLFVNNLNEMGSKNQLGDSVTFWPLLHHFTDFEFDSRVISYPLIAIVGAAFLVLLRRGLYIEAMATVTFLPSLSFYFHFYDAIPLVVILLSVVLRHRINSFSLGVIGFLIIPSEINNPKNIFLVLALLGLLLYLKREQRDLFRVASFGMFTLLIIHILRYLPNGDARINQSIIVSATMLLSYVSLIFHRELNFMRGPESSSR
jgi:hypothetical protein